MPGGSYTIGTGKYCTGLLIEMLCIAVGMIIFLIVTAIQAVFGLGAFGA